MTPEERLRNIANFIHRQKYLKGLPFTVRILDGQVRLEFKGISTEQTQKLRAVLEGRDMTHMLIINTDNKKKRRKKRKRPGNPV